MVEGESPKGAAAPERFRLGDTRESRTVEFSFFGEDGIEGKFVVGLYEDGTPGELFIDLGKQGTLASGLAEAWAIAVSMLLQYGVDPRLLYEKFKYMQFEPNGICGVRNVPFPKSVVDLIMKWMEKNLPPTKSEEQDPYDEALEE